MMSNGSFGARYNTIQRYLAEYRLLGGLYEILNIFTNDFELELSEVSCENCTHTAIVAQKIGYLQRDISGIGLHHESWWDCIGLHHESWWDCIGLHYQSCWDYNEKQLWWDCNEKQLWWDYNGIHEDENTIII